MNFPHNKKNIFFEYTNNSFKNREIIHKTTAKETQFRASKQFILNILHNHIVDYPTPKNLNYFYNFGVIAGIILVLQIITGVLLTMHYTPNTALAFLSLEHIMRDVNMGWFLRYAHANGASMFFLIVYLHIARGIFYSSYKTSFGLWISGVIIFILMMAAAFIGYVLPWGQMSFWGATVITNLFTAIPGVGPHIAFWLWGGFAVDNATLNRFFSLHYLVPFIIAAVSIIHLVFLHTNGSTNPLIGPGKIDKIAFHPYFTLKDIFGLLVFFVFFSIILFWYPNALGHPDNYIYANPLVTPLHIVPEWYFLPFYAILRACPNKIGGIALMGGAIAILLFLPLLNQARVVNGIINPVFNLFIYIFFSIFLLLGWLGAQPVEQPYIFISQVCTCGYFCFFIVVLITTLNIPSSKGVNFTICHFVTINTELGSKNLCSNSVDTKCITNFQPISLPNSTLGQTIFHFLYGTLLFFLFSMHYFFLGVLIQCLLLFFICIFYIGFEHRERFILFWFDVWKAMKAQPYNTIGGLYAKWRFFTFGWWASILHILFYNIPGYIVWSTSTSMGVIFANIMFLTEHYIPKELFILLSICSAGVTSYLYCVFYFWYEKKRPFIYRHIKKTNVLLLIENSSVVPLGRKILGSLSGAALAAGGSYVLATHSNDYMRYKMYKEACNFCLLRGDPLPDPTPFIRDNPSSIGAGSIELMKSGVTTTGNVKIYR